MKFVEYDDGQRLAKPLETEMRRHGRRPTQDHTPIVGIVPVQLVGTVRSARGRLANLTRAAHQGHLPMAGQVIAQHVVVEAEPIGHGLFSWLS